VYMDVNAPAWQEDYHVRWDRIGSAIPAFHLWKAEIPLVALGQTVGRLTVSGPRDEVPIGEKLAQLSEIVYAAERRVSEVRAGVTPHSATPFAVRSEPVVTP